MTAKRKFAYLSHPEPEDDGTFLYDLFEVKESDENEDGEEEKHYFVIARNLTLEQTDSIREAHGAEWDS